MIDAVLRTESEWQQNWATAFACRSAKPEAPTVDFSRDMVVAVAVGARGSGGFSVAIESAAVDVNGMLSVHAVEYRPGRNCVVVPVETYPVAFARVPQSDAPPVFDVRVQVADCE